MSDDLLDMPLKEFGLISTRAYWALRPYCITVRDLVAQSSRDLLLMDGIGRVSLEDVRGALALVGLSLRDDPDPTSDANISATAIAPTPVAHEAEQRKLYVSDRLEAIEAKLDLIIAKLDA